MHNEKNGSRGDHHNDDAATGEYPVLCEAIGEPTDALQALHVTEHDVTVERLQLPVPPAGEEAQVSSWLADLESEIARLHERWRQVEHGFGAKDGLIAELKTEIASRDGALADLRARLGRNADALRCSRARSSTRTTRSRVSRQSLHDVRPCTSRASQRSRP